MRSRWIPLLTFALSAAGLPAAAATRDAAGFAGPSLERLTFEASGPPSPPVALHATFLTAPAAQKKIVAYPDPGPNPQRPVAFEYSEAYHVRNKIHHIASFATLPLFITEAYVGQKMFNDPAQITSGMRHLHGNIATGIGILFGVNSVTGVWNMIEGRKDPNGLMLRTTHGVLMLVADAGFLATALTHPNSRTAEGIAIYDPKKNQHMALAYASVSTAMVGYLIMLFRH
jgi:hypothetical protein